MRSKLEKAEINSKYKRKQLEIKLPDLTHKEALFVLQALFVLNYLNVDKLNQAPPTTGKGV